MTLIKEVRKLRELEQQATAAEWTPKTLDVGDECPIILPAEITSNKRTIVAFEGGMVPLDEDWDGEEITGNAELICKMRNLASAMLEILGCFQEGDASGIKLLVAWLDEMQKNSDFSISPDHMQRLRRLQKAAALMEQERHP